MLLVQLRSSRGSKQGREFGADKDDAIFSRAGYALERLEPNQVRRERKLRADAL